MKQLTKHSRVISIFIGAIIVAATYSAGAQVLEEVIVTAQKREQNVQDIGIAISAFSGELMKKMRVTESTDVAYMSAGVFVSGSSAGQTREFTIRGVTQNDFADHAENPNATYVDEGYIGFRQGGVFAAFDLERVEILKGPQGTLFGRNATGGAFTADVVGGTIIGITSATTTTAGSPVTRTFTVAEQGVDGVDRFSGPKDVAATIEAKGAGVGTFSYDQAAWIFRGNQASNTINGTASTLLSIGGNEQYRDSNHSILAPVGAQTLTAFASNSYDPLGVAGQRHPWGSGIPTTMTGTSYRDAMGGTTTVDDAIGTQAVPGELAFMYGAIAANTGEYQPRTLV